MKALLLKLQSLVEDFEKANSQIAALKREGDGLKADYEARILAVTQREKDINLREAAIQPVENLQAAIKENDKVTARNAERTAQIQLDMHDLKRKIMEETQRLVNRELAIKEVEKNNARIKDELMALKENYKTQVLAEIARKVK